MKNTAVVKAMTNTFNKVSFKISKHSPEILLVTGIVGVIGSGIMACKATTKAGEIINEAKERIDQIHICSEDTGLIKTGAYTPEDAKKDMAIVYAQTGIKFLKLYGPSIGLAAISITSILASHNILHKRNVALAAAYATIDNSFKDYRKRVIERFGEAVDRELKYNIKAQKIEKTVVDPETGKEKKVKESVEVVGIDGYSEYARFYDDGCKGWEKDSEYNLLFLRAQERYANDLLITRGHLFLNEVYDMLGIPRTKAGQVVGWVYDPDNNFGRDEDTFNNYVSFGIYDTNKPKARDFVNGYERVILLDFNVDGNIWDLMK